MEQAAAAASQKTMTMFMLFLIIFLLEYVVYKRNGLPGLVILNVILAQNTQSPSGIGGIVDEYSVFSGYGNEIRTEQLSNLKTVIQQKEEAQHQEEYLKKQAETLKQAAEIEKKLTEARNNLGNSHIPVNTFKREEKKASQSLDTKLGKLPAPTKEEINLLSQLSLTSEQFALLASQAQYLTHQEKEEILENFPSFSQDTKVQLINSGLNNLEINAQEKKAKFIQLNQTLYQEKQSFGLSIPEKENILRLLITSLDLSTEQRTSLENMGIRFFDASNWEVSNEQKNSLLGFGCAKIKLTEEQQENLLNTDQLRNFSLTEPQKDILQSLAPLTREDKYSPESLQLLRSLNLKPTTLNFLTNEEILPNPNLDFGETKSSYLPLKTKFLEGEQKVLEQKQRQEEKKLNQQEITDKK
ncbi:12946_t:CDS:2 [Ambispora gerdemannii]|uniref:12946_t:CDS:1 n=1 Tax=Ambispora gerdemannii TaxID=144530 RepID=A0A9N8VNI2_9GLOM|nr:12946_t:CDS:2 [Ambispora gerdemannii]